MHLSKETACFMRRLTVIVLCFIIAITVFFPGTASAKEADQKVVRVGWFDSSFYYWDQFGRRCGIAYEYQQKIAAYTGWTYEYVEDSWPNLMQMLINGEIDLLSDVSFKPERAEHMSFPDLPMGTESYYIYVAAGNRTLTADDLSSFQNSRIGVNKGSIQEGFLKDWAEKYGINIEIVPMVLDEDESLEMVTRGELDGYACIYSFSSEENVIPISRVGSSDYYFAVNKDRPDLLADLNHALAGIQDEDPYFNQRLTEERLYNTRTDAFLTLNQADWLTEHGSIRIGYRDNDLPFCQADKETGELTGALKDFLAHAANNLRSTDVRFEPVPYPTTEAAMEAMKAGEIDCVFPVYLSTYDSEESGIRLTNPAMKTEMNAVLRNSQGQSLSRDSRITFAVSAGDMNIETFIKAQYPLSDWKVYDSEKSCYEAVASGDADSALVSNYSVPYLSDTFEKYKLYNVPTGESMPLSFAVDSKNRDLYFLMNKTVIMTRSEDMASALASYMHSVKKVSFTEFLKDNWIAVIAILLVVFLLVVFLLLQKLKAERKAYEHQRMMEESLRRELEQKEQLQSAMAMAYRDPLTGVKSKHAYNEAEERMDQRIAEGSVSEFSIIVFDLNDLKTINDSRGHDIGDEYIKDACKMICTCFKHSPVFRIGGDEFAAILEGEDYANQEELLERFEKQVLMNLDREKTVVAFGCSRYHAQQDTCMRAVFERADATMYKEKVLLKSLGEAAKEEELEHANQSSGIEDVSEIILRKHILVADDLESSREILGELLEDDYDIFYAADGIEAMEILHSHKDEIAVVLLDLYMPNMTGREVMTQMQVDEDLMSIPVIFLSVDLNAELDCLKIGAIDFIPKPYPDIEIIKARISKCIELSENRDLIRRTQRDKLTGLYNKDYFIRYVSRYDQHYKGAPFDAVVCDVNEFYSVNEHYGRQFGDLVLRSIGLGIARLARKTGGIGSRREGDTFLLYCPHQDDYEQLLKKFLEELFVEKETGDKVTLRFGIYANAQLEPDIEERFVRAKIAADNVEHDPQALCGYYRT